jgi:uncharacterized protein
MASSPKYVPRPEGLLLEFHQHCVRTELVHLQRCRGCDVYRHPPRYRCADCHSDAYDFVAVSGQGRIHSLVVTYFTVDRGWSDEVPYSTAIVELDEGPRLVGALPGVGPGEVCIGDAVQVIVEPRGEEFAYFRVDRLDSQGETDPAGVAQLRSSGPEPFSPESPMR